LGSTWDQFRSVGVRYNGETCGFWRIYLEKIAALVGQVTGVAALLAGGPQSVLVGTRQREIHGRAYRQSFLDYPQSISPGAALINLSTTTKKKNSRI